MRKTSRNGLTLIEVMVAGAVLTILVTLTFSIFTGGMNASQEGSVRAELTIKGRMWMDRMRQELSFANLNVLGNQVAGQLDHTAIRFTLPNRVSNPQYGYRHPNLVVAGNLDTSIQVGRFAQLRFIGNEVVREANAPAYATAAPTIPAGIIQSVYSSDLNGDGDTTDRWVLGRIWLQFLDATGVEDTVGYAVPLTDNVALCSSAIDPADLDGDINRDGTDDPVFIVLNDTNGEVTNPDVDTTECKIRLTLWVADIDARTKRLIMVRTQQEVRLENPQ